MTPITNATAVATNPTKSETRAPYKILLSNLFPMYQYQANTLEMVASPQALDFDMHEWVAKKGAKIAAKIKIASMKALIKAALLLVNRL